MTRFRSSFLALCGLLALAGCETSSGVSAPAIVFPEVAAAYIPLHKRVHLGIDSADGAAMTVAPGIAVTNAHNANLLEPSSIIGTARGFDLLFFHTTRKSGVSAGAVRIGAPVTAYGQGNGAENLRLAYGVVRSIQSCPGCTAPAYFIFTGNAGPGFSGGPVLDSSGRLIGITFGYKDDGRARLIYAYDMARVFEELKNMPGTPH